MVITNATKNIVKSTVSKSQAGRNERNMQKINQDIFIECLKMNNSDNLHLFGVCDGHG